jgi:PAS domain S-box-containing protein
MHKALALACGVLGAAMTGAPGIAFTQIVVPAAAHSGIDPAGWVGTTMALAAIVLIGVSAIAWRRVRSSSAVSGQAEIGPRYSVASLLTLVLAAAAFQLVLLIGFHAIQDAQHEIERARQMVRGLADVTAADTAATFTQAERLARALSERARVRSLDPRDCDPELEQIRKLSPQFANIATVDAEGNAICSLLRQEGGARPNIGNPPWLARLKATNGFVIGTPQKGIYSGRWIVVTAYPIRDGRGTVTGAAQVVLDVAALEPVVSPTLPAGGVAGVIDAEGIIAARSAKAEEFVGRRMRQSPVGRGIFESALATQVVVGLEGIERFYAYKAIDNTGWYAAVGVPTDLIYAQARKNAWQGALTGLLVLAFMGTLVLVIHRRIVKPLARLSDTALAIAAGDVKRRMGQAGPREVVAVAATFNRMSDQLPVLEERLRASEELHRRLFDASPNAMRVVCEGRVVMANAANRALFGLQSERELLGRDALEIMHPDSREQVRERMRLVIDEEATVPAVDLAILRADGSKGLIEVAAVPFTFEGKPASLVISRDLTEQRAAEGRVVRLARMKEVLSKTNEAIARTRDWPALCAAACRIVVEEGGLIAARIRMHDAAAGTLVTLVDAGPPVGRIAHVALSIKESNLASVQAFRAGHWMSRDDMTVADIDESVKVDALSLGIRSSAAFPLVWDGVAVGVLVVYARERAFFDPEQAEVLDEMAVNLAFAHAKAAVDVELMDAEQRYRSLVEHSTAGVALMDGDIIEYANTGLARMLGHADARELVGTSVFDKLVSAFHSRARANLHALLSGEKESLPLGRVRMRRTDGELIDVETSVASITIGGRRLVQCEVRDITRKMRALAEIRKLNNRLEVRVAERTADLVRANRDLESFSYTVAHDLRAPVRAMSGFAQLLEMDLAAGNLDSLADHARRVTGNAAKMNALIDGLLDVARVAHAEMARDRVDSTAMVEAVLAEQGARARARVTVGPLPAVMGDPVTLRQVWTNLISNALKYSARRNSPEIYVACEAGRTEAVFSVRDNGAGFNPQMAGNLFGIFQRLHGASEFEGNGVGLAIVRAVVESHGGRTWANGEPGSGATFYFALPAARIERP